MIVQHILDKIYELFYLPFDPKVEHDLNTYIGKHQDNLIKNKYLKRAQNWMILTMLIMVGINLIYFLTGLYETNQGWKLLMSTHYLFVYIVVSYVLVSNIPQIILYLIPSSVIVVAYIASEYAKSVGVGAFSEIFIWFQSFSWMAMMILPLQLSPKFGCYVIGMVLINLQFYQTFGWIKTELLAHSTVSIIFYYTSAMILYNKVRELYSLILKNENLLKEMKLLIETFPEAVLIRYKNRNTGISKYSSNHNFDANIWSTSKNLAKINDIEILMKDAKNFNDEINQIKMSLDEFLIYQEEKVHNINEVVVENILAKLNSDGKFNRQIEQGNDLQSLVHFSIKTLMLDWEGRRSYMHVFIDNTNIIQLEQANTNIKMQKIMFASSSHEFRTPLNAILNSFMLIENNF